MLGTGVRLDHRDWLGEDELLMPEVRGAARLAAPRANLIWRILDLNPATVTGDLLAGQVGPPGPDLAVQVAVAEVIECGQVADLAGVDQHP